MGFDMKKWLDKYVVPLIDDKPLGIYSFIWNGNPPKEILVWLRTNPDGATPDTEHSELDGTRWATSVKELLEAGWRFDYTREQQLVQLEGGMIKAFGGDGAPLYSPTGMASVRLFQKQDDGVGLILQVACQFWPLAGDGIRTMTPGEHAASAVKGFFAQFGTENPLEVCAKFGASFGGG